MCRTEKTTRPSKLKFKGEKTKKKRKRDDGDSGAHGRGDDESSDPDSWVQPEDPLHLRGPTFIYHSSDPPVSINYDSNRNRIVVHTLDREKKDDESEPPSLLSRVPSEVGQVWVTTRVAGSETINLRTGTGEGKFLSCDAHGLVSADREARGPQEEWTPIVLPDGMVAFKSVYEKYLSVDEVAGGAWTLRGDSEDIGFRERFWVKVQSKYKKEVNEEKKKQQGAIGEPSMDESATK